MTVKLLLSISLDYVSKDLYKASCLSVPTVYPGSTRLRLLLSQNQR